jgi:formamidopyrimidine-DNA glycosylase
MPELPEVETVVRGLEKEMRGQRIESVRLNRADLRFHIPPAVARIRDAKVAGLRRRAKYILIDLDDGRTMIVHLGMSGRMTILDDYAPQKHDHMVIALKNGKMIALNDPRRFGLVDLAKTDALDAHKFFRHLGPEPFDHMFDAAYLAQKFKNKKVAVKLAIMDQRVVVGVGNIYASEALYGAGIDPRRAAGTLKPTEIKKLVASIQDVLARAIKAGGSSLRDYVQADGELGYFQHNWAVYDKAGQTCPRCKKSCVEKITQGGRSTFYCPVRQK